MTLMVVYYPGCWLLFGPSQLWLPEHVSSSVLDSKEKALLEIRTVEYDNIIRVMPDSVGRADSEEQTWKGLRYHKRDYQAMENKHTDLTHWRYPSNIV
jgi:hypothetical protein